MKFTIAEGQSVTFDPKSRDFAKLGAALAKLDFFKEIAKEVGSASYFAAFTELEMGPDTTETFVEAYFQGGRDAVHRAVVDEKWFNEADDAYWEDVKSDFEEKLRNAVDQLAYDIVEAGGDDDLDSSEIVDELVEYLEEALRQDVWEAMHAQDTSTIDDCIPSHSKTEFIFVPDMAKMASDDLMVSFLGNHLALDTVVPDLNFMRMLQFFNIPLRDYLDTTRSYIEDTRQREKADYEAEFARRLDRRTQTNERRIAEGRDPIPADEPLMDAYVPYPHLEESERYGQYWRALGGLTREDNSESSKLIFNSDYERRHWNAMVRKLSMGVDVSRPPALSLETLRVVVENCGGSRGDVPCFVMRAKVADILDGKFDGPVLAEGGLLGLHDFLNGMGYFVEPEAPILLDPATGAWTSRIWGSSVNSVYDMVSSAFDADITPVEASSEWPMVREDVYRHESKDGLTAEIFTQRDSDGQFEYWVTTYDLDVAPAGPFETPEVWPSLAEAKEAALEALERDWEETSDMRP